MKSDKNSFILADFLSNTSNIGAFNNYLDKMRRGGGKETSVFVHAQGMKTVHPYRVIQGKVSQLLTNISICSDTFEFIYGFQHVPNMIAIDL